MAPAGTGRWCRRWLLLALLALAPPVAAEDVTVFAAASLTDALTAAAEVYRAAGGAPVRFSFASSSTLARQIEAGAPADVFASANERWMDHLAAQGLIDATSRVSPIANSLVLIAPADADAGMIDVNPRTDLTAYLGRGEYIAMGDPAHVPAGMYARHALEHLGWWAALAPRLARTDNVRAALALVERGETPLGIVYATDAAISKQVRIVGVFPKASHPPIRYPFAVIAGAHSAAVDALFRFLVSDRAMRIYRRYGFETRR